MYYKSLHKGHAQIAQLVEQRTENPRVTGSIPVLGIFYFQLYRSMIRVLQKFFCVLCFLLQKNTFSGISVSYAMFRGLFFSGKICYTFQSE